MSKQDSLLEWRLACDEALRANDALLTAWRNLEMHSLKDAVDDQDVERLRRLFIDRIFPVNAFEAVASIDSDRAILFLMSRYLGNGVDPDGKFGGFRFELASMVDDLLTHGGENALRALISHPDFDRNMLSDSRVIESFCSALDCDEAGFRKWVTAW